MKIITIDSYVEIVKLYKGVETIIETIPFGPLEMTAKLYVDTYNAENLYSENPDGGIYARIKTE